MGAASMVVRRAIDASLSYPLRRHHLHRSLAHRRRTLASYDRSLCRLRLMERYDQATLGSMIAG
jgi:hypothetical protein